MTANKRRYFLRFKRRKSIIQEVSLFCCGLEDSVFDDPGVIHIGRQVSLGLTLALLGARAIEFLSSDHDPVTVGILAALKCV